MTSQLFFNCFLFLHIQRDPLELLMEETQLHERLADTINRALQDRTLIDELDAVIVNAGVADHNDKGIAKHSEDVC